MAGTTSPRFSFPLNFSVLTSLLIVLSIFISLSSESKYPCENLSFILFEPKNLVKFVKETEVFKEGVYINGNYINSCQKPFEITGGKNLEICIGSSIKNIKFSSDQTIEISGHPEFSFDGVLEVSSISYNELDPISNVKLYINDIILDKQLILKGVDSLICNRCIFKEGYDNISSPLLKVIKNDVDELNNNSIFPKPRDFLDCRSNSMIFDSFTPSSPCNEITIVDSVIDNIIFPDFFEPGIVKVTIIHSRIGKCECRNFGIVELFVENSIFEDEFCFINTEGNIIIKDSIIENSMTISTSSGDINIEQVLNPIKFTNIDLLSENGRVEIGEIRDDVALYFLEEKQGNKTKFLIKGPMGEENISSNVLARTIFGNVTWKISQNTPSPVFKSINLNSRVEFIDFNNVRGVSLAQFQKFDVKWNFSYSEIMQGNIGIMTFISPYDGWNTTITDDADQNNIKYTCGRDDHEVVTSCNAFIVFPMSDSIESKKVENNMTMMLNSRVVDFTNITGVSLGEITVRNVENCVISGPIMKSLSVTTLSPGDFGLHTARNDGCDVKLSKLLILDSFEFTAAEHMNSLYMELINLNDHERAKVSVQCEKSFCEDVNTDVIFLNGALYNIDLSSSNDEFLLHVNGNVVISNNLEAQAKLMLLYKEEHSYNKWDVGTDEHVSIHEIKSDLDGTYLLLPSEFTPSIYLLGQDNRAFINLKNKIKTLESDGSVYSRNISCSSIRCNSVFLDTAQIDYIKSENLQINNASICRIYSSDLVLFSEKMKDSIIYPTYNYIYSSLNMFEDDEGTDDEFREFLPKIEGVLEEVVVSSPFYSSQVCGQEIYAKKAFIGLSGNNVINDELVIEGDDGFLIAIHKFDEKDTCLLVLITFVFVIILILALFTIALAK